MGLTAVGFYLFWVTKMLNKFLEVKQRNPMRIITTADVVAIVQQKRATFPRHNWSPLRNHAPWWWRACACVWYRWQIRVLRMFSLGDLEGTENEESNISVGASTLHPPPSTPAICNSALVLSWDRLFWTQQRCSMSFRYLRRHLSTLSLGSSKVSELKGQEVHPRIYHWVTSVD